MNSVFLDKVPNNWTARAYPSVLPLGAWFADLLLRIKELESWTTDFALPNVVWLAGFFNPQSFLTGKKQHVQHCQPRTNPVHFPQLLNRAPLERTSGLLTEWY